MRRLAFILALAFLGGAASARTSAAAPDPGTAPPPCAIGPYLIDFDPEHRRYAISFTTLTTATYSGTVALYAGANRYDVPFHDIVAVESHDKTTRGGGLLVAFPSPVAIAGAAVLRLTAPASAVCDAPYRPWRATPLTYAGGHAEKSAEQFDREAYLRWAQATPAVVAPPAIAEPVPSCAAPDQPARTVQASEGDSPDLPPGVPKTATAVVAVFLNGDSSVYGVRIERSSGNDFIDGLALGAAARSKFRAETFRCKPASGAFLFTYDFIRD